MSRVTAIVFTAFVVWFASCGKKADELSVARPQPFFVDAPGTVPIPPEDTDSIKITYSYGAGQCIGYCETIFEIHSWGIVKTEKSWEPMKYPTRVNLLPIDSLDYRNLLMSLNTGFYFIPERIGCPDCNDGGWEELQVSNGSRTRSVIFPHGYSVPEIGPLLQNVRNCVKR